VKDINGQDIRKGDLVQLLCEVIAVEDAAGVHVRVMNSETEMLIGCKQDEVLGGAVADSELTGFEEAPTAVGPDADDQADGVKLCPME
jgi:hypothetical protein